LPVHQFIAATNANDTVPRFLESGVYETKPSVQTYANAMDVGAPSNWVRIMDLFKEDRTAIQDLVKGYRFTDEETLAGINEIFEQFNYVACPHTAIAYLAAKTYALENPNDGSAKVFLSTAHACKFPEVFPADILAKIDLPEQVQSLKNNPELYDELGKDFEGFKGYLLGK
jgi:threonine synthase